MCPYVLIIKGQKENLNSEAIALIDPIIGWFKITQYDDKREIQIVNFVETVWLAIYPGPMEITYDQIYELIGHELRTYLSEI